jgi:hypothetical protein
MINFKDFILEHYVTIHPDLYKNPEEYTKAKKEFIHGAWDMIQNSYKKIGGLASANTPEELADDLHTIKAVRKNGKIVAFNGYKDKHGRKSVVSASDGTDSGKSSWLDLQKEDNKQKRAWGEKSGAAARMADKIDTPKIPFELAKKLVGKSDMEQEDEHSYTRKIGDARHLKTTYGYPKI